MKITCSNCHKALSIDESKLPMREVAFPCPVCKTKLTVDRRTMESEGDGAPPVAQIPVAPPSHGSDEDDHSDDFGSKALIVGKDSPEVRQAAKLIGFLPIVHTDPAAARDFYMQEFPHVVIIHPAQLTAPPLESMAAVISLAPVDRRKSFLILIADNLRTFDGNAAFLYGVNLVVATKDLAQFTDIYREAHAAHERLYASMQAVTRERVTA